MSAKRLVVHHDDLGGSHAANIAFADLMERGVVSAGSVMVPCPWFPEIAGMARAHPDWDLGVHLTLNCEYDAMRWRPLTGVKDNGLTDAEGYFPRTVEAITRADPEAVWAELHAQVRAALDAGIAVSHLDTHMMVLYQPEFISIYERLGSEFDLPIVLSRDAVARRGLIDDYAPLMARLEKRGVPIFDSFVATPFGESMPTVKHYEGILDSVGDGLAYGAFHFAMPDHDIEAFADDSLTRISDYRVFASGFGARMIGRPRHRDGRDPRPVLIALRRASACGAR